MIKEKQFNLILRKPGCADEIIAQGSQKFIEDLRIKKILDSGVPADHLVIEEARDENDEEDVEVNLGALLISLGLTILGALIFKSAYGKKK
jgi:hypothetical protein